ncbi:MAG: hypothetical protein K2Q06_02250, partial [Parvularculaceae bacterium]|nr:hypothetical protein [Parvularculaceae bacterium]
MSTPRRLEAGLEFCGLECDVEGPEPGAARRLFAAAPRRFEALVSRREDVFLPIAIFLGLVADADVDLDGLEVDPLLLRNVLAAARQHEAWTPRFRVPSVFGANEAPSTLKGQGVACFFSGGVDSFFTLTRHGGGFESEPTRATDRSIDFAAHVVHLDGLDKLASPPRLDERLVEAARSLGAAFEPIYSNMMTLHPLWKRNYARITHGAGLASVAHAFSSNIGQWLIASSHSYGGLKPWGSSPIVDPLYSGGGLRFIHDGSTFTRVEKTAFLARSPVALGALNVCDKRSESGAYRNCSRCQKCLRTMTALDLAGARGAAAFDWSAYAPDAFGHVYFKDWSERSFALELAAAARATGRGDIAEA